MSIHSPEQLKDMVRHAGENAQPVVSAWSSTQIPARMLHLHCCTATCTTDSIPKHNVTRLKKTNATEHRISH